MPRGKAAGFPCVQLDENGLCRLFGRPERPAVCAHLRPEPEMCGSSREEAVAYLARLELATRPACGPPGAAESSSASQEAP